MLECQLALNCSSAPEIMFCGNCEVVLVVGYRWGHPHGWQGDANYLNGTAERQNSSRMLTCLCVRMIIQWLYFSCYSAA